MYINFTPSFGITFQRGTCAGVVLEVFADASKAIDRRSVSIWRSNYMRRCMCHTSTYASRIRIALFSYFRGLPVQLLLNPLLNSNLKRIDVICHHFLRDPFPKGDISVYRVPSEYHHADIKTEH